MERDKGCGRIEGSNANIIELERLLVCQYESNLISMNVRMYVFFPDNMRK